MEARINRLARLRSALYNFRLQHATGIHIALICLYVASCVTGIIVAIASGPPASTGYGVTSILKGVVIVLDIPLLTVATGSLVERQLALDEHDHKRAEGASTLANSALLLALGLLAGYGAFCMFAF